MKPLKILGSALGLSLLAGTIFFSIPNNPYLNTPKKSKTLQTETTQSLPVTKTEAEPPTLSNRLNLNLERRKSSDLESYFIPSFPGYKRTQIISGDKPMAEYSGITEFAIALEKFNNRLIINNLFSVSDGTNTIRIHGNNEAVLKYLKAANFDFSNSNFVDYILTIKDFPYTQAFYVSKDLETAAGIFSDNKLKIKQYLTDNKEKTSEVFLKGKNIKIYIDSESTPGTNEQYYVSVIQKYQKRKNLELISYPNELKYLFKFGANEESEQIWKDTNRPYLKCLTAEINNENGIIALERKNHSVEVSIVEKISGKYKLVNPESVSEMINSCIPLWTSDKQTEPLTYHCTEIRKGQKITTSGKIYYENGKIKYGLKKN